MIARPSTPRALVVHESILGHTRLVAEAIAETLRGDGLEVVTGDVNEVRPDAVLDFDLVVLGAPTHAFSLSRPTTRVEAARQGALPAPYGIGLREWLAGLPAVAEEPVRCQFAVFDTRVNRVRRVPAAAAPRAVRFLHRQGYSVIAPVQGFCVTDVTGPLLPGEVVRAARWAHDVATRLQAPMRGPVRRAAGRPSGARDQGSASQR